ncbi:aquaporin 4, isoform CRA_b [Mus musculus]|nr:aquaporin 4, isoform CRA_b [Mus musculus]
MVAFKGVWTQAFWKAVSAEFLATLIFVLLGVGSTINWGGSENPLPVEDNRSQVETEDLILKPGVVHVIDIDRGEEKKGKDSSGEVLSSV